MWAFIKRSALCFYISNEYRFKATYTVIINTLAR